MLRPVPALALLVAAVSGLSAAAEPTASFKLTAQLQLRAEWSNAVDNVGSINGDPSYDVATGSRGAGDHVDFLLRRARFGATGTYGSDYKFRFIIRADRADQDPSVSTAAPSNTGSRAPVLHQVVASRDFKNEDTTITHTVQAGLDYAFFNRAEFGPSGSYLLPSQRATHAYAAQRGTGVGYRLNHECVLFGADIQNNSGDDNQGANASTEREGMWYSARVELTPPKSTEWNNAKFQEGYAGMEGQGITLGFEFGYNDRDVTASAANTSTLRSTAVWGTDLLVHWNGLSALAEYRARTIRQTVKAATGNSRGEQKSSIWLVQAGYAVPTDMISEGSFTELALRFTRRDDNRYNRDITTGAAVVEQTGFGAQDYGNSGYQYEAALNLYLNGNSNKLGLMFTDWRAESGDAKAYIARLQWALAL